MSYQYDCDVILLLLGNPAHGLAVEGDLLLQFSSFHFHDNAVLVPTRFQFSPVQGGFALDFVALDRVQFGLLPDDDLVGDGLLRPDPADDVTVPVLLDLRDHLDVTRHVYVLLGNTNGLHKSIIVFFDSTIKRPINAS